jgi:hypothetical protein
MLTRIGRFAARLTRSVSPQDAAALAALKTRGFHVVPGFLDADTCSILCRQLDELMTKHPDKVQHEQSEGTSGDYRLFGAETESPLLRDTMASQGWLRSIGCAYLDEEIATHFTMANKVEFVPGQASNSGAGWHRDSAGKQFKAIVYLTDVTAENGPFSIVPDSRTAPIAPRPGARNNNRFDDETVAAFVRQAGREVVELVGSAGTCILVDTSHVHRGKDIQAGVRYAVTNYYFRDTLEKRRKNQEKWGRHLLQPLV